VLRDESRLSGTAQKRRSTANSDRVFSEAALHHNQPRITDFLPQRKMSIFKVFALGIGLVALVESLFVVREQYLSRFAAVDASWLDLHGSMNATSFVAALMLTFATVAATLVFHIRRHRMDDYRGRYRMWYPVIGILFLAAGDVITHAHRSVQDIAMWLAPNPPLGDPASWWILVWVVCGGLLMLRAMVDARQCKSALFFWCLASAGLLTAAGFAVKLLHVPSPDAHLMAQTGAFLLGLHFLVFGLVLYARNLFLLAQGAKRSPKAKDTTSEVTDPQPTAVEKEKRTGMIRLPGLAGWRRRNASKASEESVEESETSDKGFTDEEMELLTNPDLTGTERRKLKKQMKQRRRQAA
jgi:hypothetical protein